MRPQASDGSCRYAETGRFRRTRQSFPPGGLLSSRPGSPHLSRPRDVHGWALRLSTLTARLKLYVERRELRPEAFPLLEQILQRGEMPRGDAAQVTGLKDRSAPDLLGSLVANGVLGSDTPKGAVSLRFPLHAVELLSPNLFPET